MIDKLRSLKRRRIARKGRQEWGTFTFRAKSLRVGMGTLTEQERSRPGSGAGEQRNGEWQKEMMGSEKGLVEGSGRVVGWTESVDRLLDSSPRYTKAVRAAFLRFCLPLPDSALPPEQLLSALRYFLQKIVEDLDEKAGKVCRRPVTQEDIDGISRNNQTLVRKPGQLIDFGTFDLYARHLLKRVALDRGKRLGLFMLGGLVVVHMTKGIVRKIPFIGAPIGALVNALVPTVLAGPAVGVAGAMYL